MTGKDARIIATTLEEYFIGELERLRSENAAMREELGDGYGIKDLHERTKAVRASAIDTSSVRYRLEDGKLAAENVRAWLELDDDDLFETVEDRVVGYTTILSWREHEFQYTLRIRESRKEWTAVCNGDRNSTLEAIYDGEPCEGEWFSVGRSDELRAWILGELRNSLREGLEGYERKLAEKGGEE